MLIAMATYIVAMLVSEAVSDVNSSRGPFLTLGQTLKKG
jgi:hypothetical protein